ncbi:MAG: SDR family NAD(P)-dependent oxidoreductase [Methylovulum sp.]|jgi:NAD(P)-dependent dehydrogenase (short-subunit alcohol dehydrogenase family)|nr:SDR family NAD(P)-dependent oxidoreductase [Methylovulum sp.]
MTLTDHVILITGAGGGLGSTAAVSLAKQGAHIILLDKHIAKLEQTYDAIVAANAPLPTMYPFDLAGANEDDYQELAHCLEATYGSLQGLLHSAVELSAFMPMQQTTTHDWGHTLNVNLNAPYLLTRVLLPVLQKSQHASIVFTTDSSVLKPKAYSGAYGVSKIALTAMALIFAEELAEANKVRVNILVPGPINSPLRRRTYPAEDKHKLPPMESLAPVYTYLFGAKSLGITGQTIEARNFHL